MVFRRAAPAVAVALLVVVCAAAAPAPVASNEAATAKHFASMRTDPLRLLVFLREMPKGGDLHNHLPREGPLHFAGRQSDGARAGLRADAGWMFERTTLNPEP